MRTKLVFYLTVALAATLVLSSCSTKQQPPNDPDYAVTGTHINNGADLKVYFTPADSKGNNNYDPPVDEFGMFTPETGQVCGLVTSGEFTVWEVYRTFKPRGGIIFSRNPQTGRPRAVWDYFWLGRVYVDGDCYGHVILSELTPLSE